MRKNFNVKRHDYNVKQHEYNAKQHDQNVKRHDYTVKQHDYNVEQHEYNVKQHDYNVTRHYYTVKQCWDPIDLIFYRERASQPARMKRKRNRRRVKSGREASRCCLFTTHQGRSPPPLSRMT